MKRTNNKQFWERFAKFYGPFMNKNKKIYDQICVRIQKDLTSDMRILELACGTGQLSFPLARYVKVWIATDFSAPMIREAKKISAPSQLIFSVADATHLSFENESFDAVVIANALHIMPDPGQALKEIHRVLKKDGRLYAPTFIHGTSKKAALRIRLMNLIGFHTFYQWNEHQFSSFVEKQGFHITDCSVIDSPLLPLCYLRARKN